MVSLSTGPTVNTPLLCGSKGSASAVRSSGRAQQVIDVIPEFLFSPGQADVDGSDLSLAVNQERSWERVQAAINIADLLVPQQYPIVDLKILDIRFHGIPAVFIHGDAQHGEAATLEPMRASHRSEERRVAK